MQDPNHPFPPDSRDSFDECVRENPTRAILAALGVGIVAALVVRALQPEPQPRNHVKQLLEDIRERLHDLTDPALDRLNEFAGEGSAALKKGACGVEGVGRRLRSLSGKVGSLFTKRS
jgi:ElaB/YqjD/DUF883 family membrane-anchored ribosome-binding protein